MVREQIKGKQNGVALRCDTSNHTLIDEQPLATMAHRIVGVEWAHNDGEGYAEIVQQAPFSPQFLRISQLCQTPFILNLEIDLGGRHLRMWQVF